MNTSCEFNIDTASVELRFADGTEITIYTPGVDDEICPTIPMQTEIDWLIYNEPLTYARLVFSGELAQYARDMAGTHGFMD
ncbi:MAG: DUF6061 family protein [Clostridiales bacterium]|nr:DUF6061 family protein [Clostridiales bacterium]